MGTDDSGFLSRWSQRKHAATQPESEKSVEGTGDAVALPSDVCLETASEKEVDLSSLPKLEDIVADTDLSGFLKKGVPESLRNAALRKSWALDPAIRSYVNPALDYAYDWNTPGGVPGSSELGTGIDVAKVVLQIMGDGESAGSSSDPTEPSPRDGKELPFSSASNLDAAQNFATDVSSGSASDAKAPTCELSADALSVESSELKNTGAIVAAGVGATHQSVRRHGAAKPKV
ncbi:MAG: DUF3306 domain-containing protein [Afipia sp.]|nr:DUF3306 domain-containing protein [Afipia sp.]